MIDKQAWQTIAERAVLYSSKLIVLEGPDELGKDYAISNIVRAGVAYYEPTMRKQDSTADEYAWLEQFVAKVAKADKPFLLNRSPASNIAYAMHFNRQFNLAKEVSKLSLLYTLPALVIYLEPRQDQLGKQMGEYSAEDYASLANTYKQVFSAEVAWFARHGVNYIAVTSTAP